MDTEEHTRLIHTDEIAVVTCGTTKGTMVWELYRYWSPAGYDRAVHLLENHFYDQSHFFRTVPHFLVQFGISYSPDASLQQLAQQHIPDDPQHDPPIPFTLGTISYAG
jgi:peptidyl-prolyl cis-trans isomerase A (cyclophilin A)